MVSSELIVHQQRYRPSDSNKKVYIKCSAHDAQSKTIQNSSRGRKPKLMSGILFHVLYNVLDTKFYSMSVLSEIYRILIGTDHTCSKYPDGYLKPQSLLTIFQCLLGIYRILTGTDHTCSKYPGGYLKLQCLLTIFQCL